MNKEVNKKGPDFHQSFQPSQDNKLEMARLIQGELGIIETAVAFNAQFPTTYTDLLASTDVFSVDDASKIAALESSALITAYPFLLTTAPTVPPFYRFFRTVELVTGLPRGGNSLFIGSYLTTDEVTAYYLQPPTQEQITATRSVASLSHIKSNVQPLLLLEGSSIAIEPEFRDEVFKAKVEERNTRFLGTTNKVHLYSGTIAQAIEEKVVTSELDAIVSQRADPYIFYPLDSVFRSSESMKTRQERRQQDRENDKNRKNLEKRVHPITQLLKIGGLFLVSVGAGNDFGDFKEFEHRIQLIRDLEVTLPKFSFTVFSPMKSVNKLARSNVYGGPALGVIEAVAAKKK